MSKIELLVQKAQGGLRDVYITNKGEWYRKTYDMRNYISKLHLGNLFYVLNYNPLGTFFTIVRPLDVGRSGDYEAAWIFIPSTISVLADDLIKIVSLAQQDIVNGTEQFDNLSPLLNNVYPDLQYIDYNPIQQTPALAYRLYGQNTDYVYLGSLLQKGIDQSYYKKYQAVFFFDLATRNSIPSQIISQMADLSKMGFEQPAFLFPPQHELPNGIQAFLGQSPFNSMPIKVALGSNVQLQLLRSGFENIVTTIRVNQPRQILNLQGEIPWEKQITRKKFRVSIKGREVTQYQIYVNGILLLEDHPISIPERQVKLAKIEIKKSGCVPYTGRHDLSSDAPIFLNLTERIHVRPGGYGNEGSKPFYANWKFIVGAAFYTLLILCLGISIGTAKEGNSHTNGCTSNTEIVGDTINTDKTTNNDGGKSKRKMKPNTSKDEQKKSEIENSIDEAEGQGEPQNNDGNQNSPNLSPHNNSNDEE